MLEATQRSWVGEGGHALWIRADAGSAVEPLSGALSLVSSAADIFDSLTLRRILEALGNARDPLAALLPNARPWLGAPETPGRRPVEALVSALTRLLEACPRPLLILADGLDRLDEASRRWLAWVVTARAALVVGSTGGTTKHGLPLEIRLSVAPGAAGDDDALSAAHAEILNQARVLGLPFGPRLARAIGRSADEVSAAALEAEAVGSAVWDGSEVAAREGRPIPAVVARAWCREAAGRLDPETEPLLVARFALLGRDRERLATVLPAVVEEASRLEPALALELLESGPSERVPSRQLRHLRIALLAHDLVAARRVVTAIDANPAATAVDRAEARGDLALATGAVPEAIRELRRAASSLGEPVRVGVLGRIGDLVAELRLRMGRRLYPRPEPRLARVLAHLYDLHFSSDTAPLVRLQALWEQSEPLGEIGRAHV